MPRLVPRHLRRLSRYDERLTASRNTGNALASAPSRWPVAVVSPGRSAFISRNRIGSRFRASASRSMWTSTPNCVCGAPKPLNAPLGGVCVIIDAAANADVVAAIRPRRVDDAAREHDGAQRRVCAAVHHHIDVHRREPAVALHTRAMTNDGRMTFRRRQEILDAVVDHLHGPAGLRAPGSPRDTPAWMDILLCRQSRRRSRSARRARDRAEGRASRPAPCARSTDTAASHRR